MGTDENTPHPDQAELFESPPPSRPPAAEEPETTGAAPQAEASPEPPIEEPQGAGPADATQPLGTPVLAPDAEATPPAWTEPGAASGASQAPWAAPTAPTAAVSGTGAREEGSRRGGRPQGRKGRGPGWIWAVIVVLLLCCGLSTCGALFGGFGLLNANRAKAEDALKKADAHWAKAVAELEKMNAVMAKASTIDPKNPSRAIAGVVTPARKGVVGARAELVLAKGAMLPLGKSKMKTSYLAAIAEADKGLTEFDAMLAYLTKIGKLYELALRGAGDLKTGASYLDQAVAAANKGDFVSTRRAAVRAEGALSASRTAFNSGQKLDPAAGFKKALAYTTKLSDEASVLKQLADAGAAKQTSRYNTLAGRQRALQSQVSKLPLPDLVAQKDWAKKRLDRYVKTIKAHVDAADRLQKAAHKAFDAGQY